MKRVTDDDVVLGDDYAFYYEDEPFTGVVYDTRRDGSLWSENTYTRGWRNGPSTTWYPGGQVKLVTPYSMGWVHGVEEEWFPDGRLKRRTRYEHSVRTHEEEFGPDGTLIREWRIDPASPEYRRLEANRKNEHARLEKIFARYGRPEPDEA